MTDPFPIDWFAPHKPCDWKSCEALGRSERFYIRGVPIRVHVCGCQFEAWRPIVSIVSLVSERFGADIHREGSVDPIDRYTLGGDARKAWRDARTKQAAYRHWQNGQTWYDHKEIEAVALKHQTVCAFCSDRYDDRSSRIWDGKNVLAGWMAVPWKEIDGDEDGPFFCSKLCWSAYSDERQRERDRERRQIEWLQKGRRKLTEIRRLLRNPASNSNADNLEV